MKFAPIAPPHILAELGPSTSSYHLALAQELLRDGEYRRYYRRAAYNGHFVIVDNGAAEGEMPEFGKVLEAAEAVKADEVALPDELRNGDKTVEMTCLWAKYVLPKRRFIIPQGDTLTEWRECLLEIHKGLEGQFATIGIPKHLERHPEGRYKALCIIRDLGWHLRYHIHLLGVWEHTFTEMYSASRAQIGIRGFDTGAPVALAQHEQSITHHKQQRRSLDWRLDAPSPLVRANIETVKFWAQSMFGVSHG